MERRVISDRVDVRLVNLKIVAEFRIGFLGIRPNLSSRHTGLGQQFVISPDRFHLARFLANPDRQRCAPEPLARKSPIHIRFEEVSEPAVFDVLRQPVDLLVVRQHLVFELSGPYEPTFTRILDQRIVRGSPAKRIIVEILFLEVQQLAFFEIANDRFVSVFDPHPFKVRSLFGKSPVGRYGAKHLWPFATFKASLFRDEQFIVDFTERGRLVNRTTTAFGCDKIGAGNTPVQMLLATLTKIALGFAMLFVKVIKGRLITLTNQLGTFASRFDGQFSLELFGDFLDQLRRQHDIRIQFRVVHRRVFDFIVDCGKLIRWQRPWRRRPNKQARVLLFEQREQDEHAGVSNLSVSLANFAATESSTALSPPPDDLVALVQQVAIEQVLQGPPNRFNVALVISHIGFVQFDPEPKPLGQSLPLLHVLPHALLAAVDKRLDTELLDFVFGVDAHRFADFRFDG